MFTENPDDNELSYLARPAMTDNRWAILVPGAHGTGPHPESWHSGPHDEEHQVSFQRLAQSASHRLEMFADARRVIAVAPPKVQMEPSGKWNGQTLAEPGQAGTAAAFFLAASYVLEYDPKATLLLYPVDHAAHPEARFQGYLLRLCLLAELFHDQVVVLGAAPEGAEHDYSWVMPGGVKSPSLWIGAGPSPLGMVTYHDRPNGDDAQRLFDEGGLLNTGICAVKAKTLWKLGWNVVPDAMRQFDTFRQVLHAIKHDLASSAHEQSALDHLYANLPVMDFSADLLQHTSEHLTVLPMDDVSWSDSRNPSRMHEIVERGSHRATLNLAAHHY